MSHGKIMEAIHDVNQNFAVLEKETYHEKVDTEKVSRLLFKCVLLIKIMMYERLLI